MGYNSPVAIMQNHLRMELEDGIYKAVQKVDVEVDKDELIRALRYDRAQYNKGYNEARKDTARDILDMGTKLYEMSYHKSNAILRLLEWIKVEYSVDIGEENV